MIPGIKFGDIVKIRSVVNQDDYVVFQFVSSCIAEGRNKDRSIVGCAKAFDNRRSSFPTRGDVLVHIVDKYSVCFRMFFILLNFKQ